MAESHLSQWMLSFAAWSARSLPQPAKDALYRIKPLARLIRAGLNRAAPQGLVETVVAAGELAGAHLLLDMQTEKDYWLGTYEAELQSALRELIKPGMVAYDVGANIGYISLMLARLVGAEGHVFAFEALPDNIVRLRRNLALNGEDTKNLEERVTVIPTAVVEANRPVQFLVGPSGGMGKADGSAGRQDIAYHDIVSVTGLSLDEFVFQQGNPVPQIVKMDIEGGEVLALPGMSRLLMQVRPIILIELHGPQAAQVAWKTLKDATYRLTAIQPGFPEIINLEAVDWKAYVIGIPR